MANVQYLQDAAEAMDKILPDYHGFIIIEQPFGDPPEGGKYPVRYVSKMARKRAKNVLKEWLIRAAGEEESMKHIK